MGMRSWLVRHRSNPAASGADDDWIVPRFVGLPFSDLPEQLRLMRGNVTTPMPAGAGGAQRCDQVIVLSRAARDNKWIERSNEDAVLRSVTEYRSIDDPARRRTD